MLKRAWADAIPRRDEAVVRRILADDFEGIEPLGNFFSKAAYLSDLRGGVFSNQPIVLDEIKTRSLWRLRRGNKPHQDSQRCTPGSDEPCLRQASEPLAVPGRSRIVDGSDRDAQRNPTAVVL